MKRMRGLLGMVLGIGVMVLVAPVFGSQIIGTPLWTDPEAEMRIRRADLPEGFQFGEALPMAIDLEVKWSLFGPPAREGIYGIFIDRCGTIRVVDGHPPGGGFLRGMRVWKGQIQRMREPFSIGRERWSSVGSRFWKIEKETRNAAEDRGVSLVGPERSKVLFCESHRRTRYWRDWPLEVEELIKTVFRGCYEYRAPRGITSGRRFYLARCPNNPEIMAFATVKPNPTSPAIGPGIVSLFITINKGKSWIEINTPELDSDMKLGHTFVGGLAITKEVFDTVKVFLGATGRFTVGGGGSKLVQSATLCLLDLYELIAQK